MSIEVLQDLAPNRLKVLSYPRGGLNDAIGCLIFNIQFFEANKLTFDNLHFSHHAYKELDKYFNFCNLVYVENPDFEKYDFISNVASGSLTYSLSTERVNKYISFKKEFVEEGAIYSDYICVHFRHIRSEDVKLNEDNRKEILASEIAQYSKAFLKNYSETEKYLVLADHPVWNNYFENKSNIMYLVLDEPLFAPFHEARNRQLLFAVKQICAMAACKKIYVTEGNFYRLTKLIKNDLNIEKIV